MKYINHIIAYKWLRSIFLSPKIIICIRNSCINFFIWNFTYLPFLGIECLCTLKTFVALFTSASTSFKWQSGLLVLFFARWEFLIFIRKHANISFPITCIFTLSNFCLVIVILVILHFFLYETCSVFYVKGGSLEASCWSRRILVALHFKINNNAN